MYIEKLTNQERDFILKNFKNIKNFIFYFSDMSLLESQLKTKKAINVDLIPYSSDGLVTGIVTAVRLEEDSLKLDMFIRGAHRTLDTLEECAENFLMARDKILKDSANCSWTIEEINDFVFAKNKPFLLEVVEGIVTEIKPLDFSWYDEYYYLFKKLTKENEE